MKAIDYSYFIEKYISGEMNPAEKSWFETEIEGNEALKKEICLRKKTDEILLRRDLTDLRKKLAAIESARKKKADLAIARKNMILRSAAVIALFILLGGTLLLTNRSHNPESIFMKNFTPYEPGGTVRSSENSSDIYGLMYNKAVDLYKIADYESASEILREYLELRQSHMEAHLIFGIISTERNNFKAAENSFRKIIDDGNNLYIDKAQWYLALSYLKSNNTKAAISEFLAIRDSKSVYSPKAANILKKIR